MKANSQPPGARDFDFLHGAWKISNERLVSRLASSTDWEQFEAEGRCEPILGGAGNIDDFRPQAPAWDGFVGASLRIFNPATGLWKIYWADTGVGDLTPPVIGRFVDGVGEFFGDDWHDGTPVRVRFRWTADPRDAPRWEQAFSVDDGASWETNWIMRFRRDRSSDAGGQR